MTSPRGTGQVGLGISALLIALAAALMGCQGSLPRPMAGLNRQLARAGTARSPSLSGRWLALITSRDGRQRIVLIDVEAQKPVPVPGLNRPDSQPLSVSVDQGGQRLAVVRQRQGRTELVLYRRDLMSVEPIPMAPAGVPSRVSLRADGRELAVQVSRGGGWQVDLIRIP